MKFLDDNVNIEDLEQDDWTLSNPKHSKNENLRVLGICGRQGTTKLIVCECKTCKQDMELFRSATFVVSKHNWLKGCVPCGCADKRYWEPWQYEILVNRKIENTNYVLNGFVETGTFSKKTKLNLHCKKHNFQWSSTTIKDFLNGTGCPICGREIVTNSRRLNDEDSIKLFRSIGYKEDVVFKRIKDIYGNDTVEWEVFCPSCDKDIFSKHGVSNGVFRSTTAMISDRIICRCSKKHNLTKEENLIKVKDIMKALNSTDVLLGYVGEYIGTTSTIERRCIWHGNYTTKMSNFFSSLNGCPQCSNQIQNFAYINGVFDKDRLVCLKFGITKQPSKRYKQQSINTNFSITPLSIYKFSSIVNCKKAEKQVKLELPSRFLSKNDLPDGYTETCDIKYLEDIIKIYEEFGGILIS